MKTTLRIAHCSDIHLDSNAPGTSGNDTLRHAFAAALADMQAHRPDIMLLAGDLFDSNRPTDATVHWAMDILGAQPFPVVIIPGNHDCMEPSGVIRRFDFNSIPNVRMLAAPDGEIAFLPELGTAVWGKGMVEHNRTYRPLAGCPERPEGVRWYLGMGHGLCVPHGGDTDRSSPIHMCEIETSPCDYLGLGHHHAAMELVTDHSAAAYSGSCTDNIGRGHSYVIVDLGLANVARVGIHVVGT
ncbi:MAG: hypothetical protein EXR01_05175 [Acetobacteraceae bacterium]|nr:hypothetical protein [Acetobacteraceae bacterium]